MYRYIFILDEFLVSFSNLPILLTLFFSVATSLLQRLSIQYVYERVILFLSAFILKAGAKVSILFYRASVF